MNLTVDELLALARFINTFIKQAMDMMTAEDTFHLQMVLRKLLAYSQAERERRFREVEGFYDPLR